MKKKTLSLVRYTKDVDSLEGVPDIDPAYLIPEYKKNRNREINRLRRLSNTQNFLYYHHIIEFLMDIYDTNWKNSRNLFVANSEKIFKIVGKYRKFRKHNADLAFDLERKVRAELNKI